MSAPSKRFADHLETKMRASLDSILQSEVYQRVSAPNADTRLVISVIKNILLEVYSYGGHVTEATFTAIGRFPKDRPDLMKPMILHDIEEADHGEMALKDYIKLGGDETWARTRRITPESFVMGATVRMLATQENPFAYLGYMYPFESLTPILTEKAQAILSVHGFPREARKFIDFHALEDIAHAKALRAFIERVVKDYPEAAAAIEYGFDCFTAVYPLPIWKAALARAEQELESQAAA